MKILRGEVRIRVTTLKHQIFMRFENVKNVEHFKDLMLYIDQKYSRKRLPFLWRLNGSNDVLKISMNYKHAKRQ